MSGLLLSQKVLKSILDWLVFNDCNFCGSNFSIGLETLLKVIFIYDCVSLALSVLKPEIEPVFAR